MIWLAPSRREHPVRGEPALLTDHEIFELPGLGYPVVGAAPGKDVEGQIYRHLSAEDYARLDAYEGVAEDLYQRIEVEVVTDGTPERAFVYMPTDRTLGRYR